MLEALDEGGYTMGGEQSGHVIFRDRSTTGDGLLTGLLLADVVKRAAAPLADLAAAAMTRMPQVLLNIPVTERVPDAADQVAAEIAAVESRLAGKGRVLVRPSGTEPLLRVMVEATDATVAHETAEQLAAVVRARWGTDRPAAESHLS